MPQTVELVGATSTSQRADGYQASTVHSPSATDDPTTLALHWPEKPWPAEALRPHRERQRTDTNSGHVFHEVQAAPRLLTKFAELAEQPPLAFLRFARRWGPLGLCTHGKPASHVPPEAFHDLAAPYERDDYERRWMAYVVSEVAGGDLAEPEPVSFPSALLTCQREPFADERVAIWRRYAREANTMIDLLGELAARRPAPPIKWRPLSALLGEPVEMVVDEPPRALSYKATASDKQAHRATSHAVLVAQREVLAWCVDEWLRLGGIRPRIEWDRHGVRLDLVGASGLFAALALQLADLVNDHDNAQLRCTECGRRYRPKRRPAIGQDNFCTRAECQAARKRRYRQRKSETS